MKNIFAILLCIAMMLSLVACAESQDNGQTVNNNQNNAQIENNSNNIETTPDEPTAEEWDAIDKYRVIMNALMEVSGSSIPILALKAIKKAWAIWMRWLFATIN